MTSDSMSLLKIANLNNNLMHSDCTIEFEIFMMKNTSQTLSFATDKSFEQVLFQKQKMHLL